MVFTSLKIITVKEIENIKKQNLDTNIKRLDELIKQINEKKEIFFNLSDKNLKSKEEIKKLLVLILLNCEVS